MSSIASPITTMRVPAIFLSSASNRSLVKRGNSGIRLGLQCGLRSAECGMAEKAPCAEGSHCDSAFRNPHFAFASRQHALSPEPKRQPDTSHEPRLRGAGHVLIVVNEMRAAVGVQLPWP